MKFVSGHNEYRNPSDYDILAGVSYKKNEVAVAVENDIVLIHVEDAPVSFARVEEIKPDARRGWYVIKLFLLQVPLQVVSWILKDVYINGEEFFMGGKKMKLEVVRCPKDDFATGDQDAYREEQDKKEPEQKKQPPDGGNGTHSGGRIISFAEMKKNRR